MRTPSGAAAVAGVLPDDDDVTELADVFGLLSDPARLRLLAALAGTAELCVSELATLAGASESAVSHALRLLRAHRVVMVRRAGRLGHYRLADEHVRMLLDVALAHTRHTTAMHPERGDAR